MKPGIVRRGDEGVCPAAQPDKMVAVMSYESRPTGLQAIGRQDWTAVVALKPAAVGKSRLAALAAPLRRRLAVQMALDTLTALASATARLVVVSNSTTIRDRLRRAGITADVIADPDPGGLNNALRAGESVLKAAGARKVLACVGDLPALTTEAVDAVIATMVDLGPRSGHRGFVADHDGTGSTMLLADGVSLDPRFGAGSAAAHRASGAVDLARLASDPGTDSPGADGILRRARTDVDDPDDLPRAIGVGVGRHTASLIGNGRLADYVSLTVTGSADSAVHFTATSDSGREFTFSDTEVDAAIGSPRIGDRLHAAVDEVRVISVWSD